MLPAVAMDLYWTRRMFFHFPSRQNIEACVFEVGDDKKWLGLFLLENAFLCVSTSGWVLMWFPSPQCLDTLCCLMYNSNNPCEKGMCWFFPLGRWGTESQRQKGDFPKGTRCLMQWHPEPTPPRSREVSQDSFRTSLWAFFIWKMWCLCFSKLQQVSHWPSSMRSARAGPTAPGPLVDMNGQYMAFVLACDHSTASVWANASAQVWSALPHSCQDGALELSGEHMSTELFPKPILLGWGEHSLAQPLLSAQGIAPRPVLFGFLGIISLHL